MPLKKKYISLKITYQNINIQVYTLNFVVGQQSLILFTGFGVIFAKKYGSFSPKIGRRKNYQNPFPVILRIKKVKGAIKLEGEGGG